MSNKLVSIIIPVFNGEKYVKEAINSALAQSYKNIEIIVVNDGSTDKSREICLSYHDKIRYLEKENGGVASALNLAIQNMKGEYFSWLSHDDLYYSDKIEKQYNCIVTKPKNTIIYSHEDIIDANGVITRRGTTFPTLKNTIVFELLHNRFIGGCSLLIPKSAFQKTGLFNEKMITTQDYDMWFRFMIEGFVFHYLPITSGASRVHQQQVSVQKKSLCRAEIERDFINIINLLPRNLIVGNAKKEADVFYKLAFKFKIKNEKKISSHCLKIGDSIFQKNINIFLKYRVIFYIKLPFIRRVLSYIKRRLLRIN